MHRTVPVLLASLRCARQRSLEGSEWAASDDLGILFTCFHRLTFVSKFQYHGALHSDVI